MKRLHAMLRANVAINVTAICNDTCNVAEVGTISTFGTMQETLPATPAKPAREAILSLRATLHAMFHRVTALLGHAQLTRGADSGPRNRILPDLVSSSPFPSPFPCFFVLEPPKRDLGTRSDPIQLEIKLYFFLNIYHC